MSENSNNTKMIVNELKNINETLQALLLICFANQPNIFKQVNNTDVLIARYKKELEKLKQWLKQLNIY